MPETGTIKKDFFLYPGYIFAQKEKCSVVTVLGSCVSVCLWDPVLRIGGMNHYMLALWNGEGLPSPKYGNIAIEKLIEKMLRLGSRKADLTAKVFGGGEVLESSNGILNISRRNIDLAKNILQKEQIPVVASDVGGHQGRKLVFNTETGSVLVRKVAKTIAK